MANQKNSLARSRSLGDKVAGSSEGSSIDPPRFKPESIELRAQDVANLPHSCEIHRAAVDVDEPLEQSEAIRGPRIYCGDDRAFSLIE
jgi:hypothetical protein